MKEQTMLTRRHLNLMADYGGFCGYRRMRERRRVRPHGRPRPPTFRLPWL